MTPLTTPPNPEPCEAHFCETLSDLSSAISSALESLVAWDVAAFDVAVAHQRELCDQLAAHPEWGGGSLVMAMARNVQCLNRVYVRLLQHSASWTRTSQSILHSGCNHYCGRASVHFRG